MNQMILEKVIMYQTRKYGVVVKRTIVPGN